MASIFGKPERMSLGQAIYTAILSVPDGVETYELVAEVWERMPHYEVSAIEARAETLRTNGYVLRDQDRWYAPGPELVVWDSL
jgi:hypothetical protein